MPPNEQNGNNRHSICGGLRSSSAYLVSVFMTMTKNKTELHKRLSPCNRRHWYRPAITYENKTQVTTEAWLISLPMRMIKSYTKSSDGQINFFIYKNDKIKCNIIIWHQ